MLYLILVYFIISLICFFAGFIFYILSAPLKNKNIIFQKPLISFLLTGLILVTSLGQLIILFFPLNIFSLFAVIAILIIFLFIYKKNVFLFFKNAKSILKEKSIFFFLCFSAFLFMILVLNAGPTIMDDTDSYHIQTIKWAQEYGSVPGIANLHLRFGFNSAWFISIALLSLEIKGINNYMVLNGLLSVWFCYYFLEKIFLTFSKQFNASVIKAGISCFFILLFAFFVWPMIRGSAASANYDFITTSSVIVLFIETIINNNDCEEWLIWPAYLFTIRIINYPLLLLTIVALFKLYKDKKIKNLFYYSSLILFIIIPSITRTTILSGYPFFPIYQVDLFSFDWKADKLQTADAVNYIKYFNRVNIQNQPLSVTMQLQFPGWIKAWYHFLFFYDKILITASFSCYFIIIILWKKIKKIINFNARFFLLILILQLVSWFLIAPDARFAYGPLLCSIFLLLFIASSSSLTFLYSKIIFTILTVSGILFYTLRKIEIDNRYGNWIVPLKLPAPPVKTILINGIELKIPEKVLNNWNPRCYDTELPCLYEVDPRLRPRGKSIQQGFRLQN